MNSLTHSLIISVRYAFQRQSVKSAKNTSYPYTTQKKLVCSIQVNLNSTVVVAVELTSTTIVVISVLYAAKDARVLNILRELRHLMEK